MSFLSRVQNGLAGVVDAGQNTVGFFTDVAKAFGGDYGKSDGFWSAIYDSSLNRSGKALEGLVGREGLGGQIFGAVPEFVRKPWREVIGDGTSVDKAGFGWDEAFGGGLLGFLEGVGREFIREPISTAVTAASLGQSATYNGGKERGFFDGFDALFSKDAWEKAHEISQHRSLGQAVAAAIMTKDILDPDEMIKAQNSAWFGIISGGFDFAARMTLDPDVLLAKAGAAAKGKTVLGRMGVATERLEEAVAKRSTIMKAAQMADEGRTLMKKLPGDQQTIQAQDAARLAGGIEGRVATIAAAADDAPLARWTKALGDIVDPDAAKSLTQALDAAKAGDQGPLKAWAAGQRVAPRPGLLENIADGTEFAADAVQQIAKRKGFDAIELGDQTVDLGTIDRKLAKQVERTQNKRWFGLGSDNPYARDALAESEWLKTKFEAWRAGGFDELVKRANNDVFKASADLKVARESFLRSKHWEKTLNFLGDMAGDPAMTLGRRSEIIRDRLLRNTTDGDITAQWLALAQTNEERTAVMRVLLGDTSSLKTLQNTDPAMARDIAKVAIRRQIARSFSDVGEHVDDAVRHTIFNDTALEFELMNDPLQAMRENSRWGAYLDAKGKAVADVVDDIDLFLRGAERETVDVSRLKPFQQTRAQYLADQFDKFGHGDDMVDATPGGNFTGGSIGGVRGAADDLTLEARRTRFGPDDKITLRGDEFEQILTDAEKWDQHRAARQAAADAKAVRGRKRGFDAIDARFTEEMSRRPEMGFTREQRDALGAFAREMGEDMFDDLALSIKKGDNPDVLGRYNFGSQVATIFSAAVTQGRVEPTMFHELLHHLSRYVPDADVVKLEKQFVRERKKVLDLYPFLKPKLEGKLGAGDLWNDIRWSKDEVAEIIAKYGEDVPNKILVPDGPNTVKLVSDRQMYRTFNIDEFFAETLTDIAVSRHLPSDASGLLAKGKEILDRVIAWVAKTTGRDQARRIYDNLASGAYRSEALGGMAPEVSGVPMNMRNLTDARYADRGMTMFAENADQGAKAAGAADEVAGAAKTAAPLTGDAKRLADHARAVENALKAGEYVPPQVLADYPALAAKYGRRATQDPGSAVTELERMLGIANRQRSLLKLGGNLRSASVVEQIWESPHNKLRVLFDMRAQPYLVADDPMIAGKLKRHLRDAGFTKADQEQLLGEFAAVRWDDQARSTKLIEIQEKAIKRLAEKHGLDPATVEAVQRDIRNSQSAANKFLQNAKLFAGNGPDGNWSRLTIEDPTTGATEHIFVPLTPEQLANSHVMPNYRDIEKGILRIKGLKKYGYKAYDDLTKYPLASAELINKYWKPAALMRPAWPMRVVFDEQIRMMSVMGVMGNLSEMPGRFRDLRAQYMRKLFPELDHNRNAVFLGRDAEGRLLKSADEASMRLAEAVADPRRAAKGGGLAGGVLGFALTGGNPLGVAAGAALGGWRGYRNAEYANGLQALFLSNTRGMAFDGYHFMTHFGDPGHVANMWKEQVSAARQMDSMLLSDPTINAGELKLDRKKMRLYTPGEAGYESMWNTAVNHQFSNSEFSKMLWNDELSDRDIVEWLRKDERGKATLANMGKAWREDPDEWVKRARGYANTNLIPITEDTLPLRAKLAQGEKVSIDEVKRALGPQWDSVLGTVHGQTIIEIADQKTMLGKMAKAKVDRIMDHLGVTPTDTLSREPFFRFQYEREVQRKVSLLAQDLGDGDVYRMSAKELRNIEDQARRVALKNTRHMLYDLAEESEFGHMVRFMMPFFNAYQEVFTRYAGIAVDNPVYMLRVAKAYQGLDEIGETYTDDRGQKIQRFRIPEFAKGLINAGLFESAVDDQGYIAFDKSSLNMLAGGMPSFGPLVSMPAAKLINANPDLEESLSFMFPYGTPAGMVEAFAPSWARRVISAEAEDRSFTATMGGIAMAKLTRMQEEGNPPDFNDPAVAKAFFDDVKHQAKQLYHLRTAAALVSPVAPQFQSPYQDYIDAFRKLQREDPTTAEEKFLNDPDLGERYFALTQAMSKVLDGVPATAKAEQVRKKYEDIIETYPEFGRLILGDEGAGVAAKFSRAIYTKQMSEKIGNGSDQNRREHLSLEELVRQPETRLGWNAWSSWNDYKQEQLKRLGVTSITDRRAKNLQALQQQVVRNLAEKYPSWYRDFVEVDDTKWMRRMEAFNAIANTEHQELYNRPDIRGLRDYMDARAWLENKLAQRGQVRGGSEKLTAKSNKDLLATWQSIQFKLTEENPAFAALHQRWLSNDPVERESWMGEAA